MDNIVIGPITNVSYTLIPSEHMASDLTPKASSQNEGCPHLYTLSGQMEWK